MLFSCTAAHQDVLASTQALISSIFVYRKWLYIEHLMLFPAHIHTLRQYAHGVYFVHAQKDVQDYTKMPVLTLFCQAM